MERMERLEWMERMERIAKSLRRVMSRHAGWNGMEWKGDRKKERKGPGRAT